MATKRATPANVPALEEPVKATRAKKAAAPDPSANGEKKGRRVMGSRNWLAYSIDETIRANGGPITVKDIVQSITNIAGEHPSSGAVAAALIRWAENGYIKTTEKPLGFKGFERKWSDKTLDAFLESQKENRAKERKAAREAAA